MLAGLVLWLPRRGNMEARGSLGASLLTGAGISLAFFFLQDANQRNEKKVADRQALHLRVGLTRDLSGSDLRGSDLRGVDLGNKDLSGADLRGADLDGDSLIGADLHGATLEGAHLRGADLTKANLIGAFLNGADLRDARLGDAHLQRAQIGNDVGGRAAELSGAWLVDAHLHETCLADADLRRAVVGGADLSGAILSDADLRGARLERDGVPANLVGAWLARVKVDSSARGFLPHEVGGSHGTRAAAQPSPKAPPESVADRVIRVSDGDTVELERRGWVRLIGIDAPDLNDPVGSDAKRFVEREVRRDDAVRYKLGRMPREVRAGGAGPWPGRWRAYIWLSDGRFLNGAILAGGYAERQTDQPEDARYVPALDEAERRAKAAGKHIWAACRQQQTR
jgi:uncharacterized protein YjbI with pentapeptide repeats/endonuclease YncB( thermonuclease family)